MASFTKCSACGKIFSQTDGETECPACRGESGTGPSKRDQLRQVKSHIRDLMTRGEFGTIADVAHSMGIEQKVIWEFIESGEIDLTPFDDPQVRNFLVNKRREQQQRARRDDAPRSSDKPDSPSPSSGFHGADRDDRGH
jgi:hypothetical protein